MFTLVLSHVHSLNILGFLLFERTYANDKHAYNIDHWGTPLGTYLDGDNNPLSRKKGGVLINDIFWFLRMKWKPEEDQKSENET